MFGQLFAALLGAGDAQALLGQRLAGGVMGGGSIVGSFVLGGDLLFHRRDDAGDFAGLLLPFSNLCFECTQFAAAGDQSAGGVPLADDHSTFGREGFAGEGDEIGAAAAALAEGQRVIQVFDNPGVGQQAANQRGQVEGGFDEAIGAADHADLPAQIDRLPRRPHGIQRQEADAAGQSLAVRGEMIE